MHAGGKGGNAGQADRGSSGHRKGGAGGKGGSTPGAGRAASVAVTALSGNTAGPSIGAAPPRMLRQMGSVNMNSLTGAGSWLLRHDKGACGQDSKLDKGSAEGGQGCAQTLTLAFADRGLERAFTAWHAKQRWPVS